MFRSLITIRAMIKSIFLKIKNNKLSGSAILVSIVIMGSIFIMAFGSAYMSIVNMSRGTSLSDNIKAEEASRSGIERFKFEVYFNNFDIEGVYEDLVFYSQINNDLSYTIYCNDSTGKNVFYSLGDYKGSKISTKIDIKKPFICGSPLEYDDYVYGTVEVGSQCWTSENLRYLPSVSPGSIGSSLEPLYYVHSYNGDSVEEAKLSEIYQNYGAHYNYKAALIACPSGWRLPNDNDFKELETFIGMTEVEVNSTGWRGDKAGLLKSCRQVESPLGGFCATDIHPRWEQDASNYGTDDYNLSFIGGGYRHHNDGWHASFLPYSAYFWIDSGASGSPYYRYVSCSTSGVGRSTFSDKAGFQVRCILD